MRTEDAIEMERKAFERRISIRLKKAHDYAKEEDCLANFKKMAKIAEALELDITKPHGVAMWHLLHKVVRIVNLWNQNAEPDNESLEDTHDDLSNYNDLAKENYLEWKQK